MNPVQAILILLVRLYRWTLSPAKTFLFGPLGQCRFTPSCSEYGLEALRTHGAMKGGWLAAKRVCRCHPWGDCGHDPVPEKFRVSSFEFRVSSAGSQVANPPLPGSCAANHASRITHHAPSLPAPSR